MTDASFYRGPFLHQEHRVCIQTASLGCYEDLVMLLFASFLQQGALEMFNLPYLHKLLTVHDGLEQCVSSSSLV